MRDALGYHVEYAFSCMGYEIAGGIGVRRGAPDRDAIVMVGDGSYLMLHTELVTAVAEGIKIVVVLIQNNGYASIGHLSETVGPSGTARSTATWTRPARSRTTRCCPSTSRRTPARTAST